MAKTPIPPDDEESAEVEIDAAFGHARNVIERITGQKLPKAKNPHAQALGKLGASAGGKARAEKLGAKRRSAIARKAARKRWGAPK